LKLDAVELLVVRLPLVRPFVTAHRATSRRDVLLVHVSGEQSEGWGECGADTTPDYWWETVSSAQSALPAIALGKAVAGHPMAHAAFEMAVLDAELRAAKISLAAHLGATRQRVIATATAGFDDDVESFVAAGYRSIKVKVSPDHPLSPRATPDSVTLQVDANGSYASEPDRVRAFDDLGLLAVEQPLAAEDLEGHATLSRELRTPVCLDESVASLDLLDAVIAMRAANGVSVKPARLGGIDAARQAHDRCVEAGMAAKVGGLLETGIGRAAALAVAALPGFVWPADLSASDRYWREDVTEPFELDPDGCLVVPSRPGLGVTVRPDVIRASTVWREQIVL
jgi:O-succinylbenzoate synthase